MKESIQHNGMYIPQTKKGYILTMPQGGPFQYRSKFEAEAHTRLFNNARNTPETSCVAFERKIEDTI